MLAYLDALISALTAHDVAEITRLLDHPLARILSREALAEAQAAAQGKAEGAPLRVLELRHQTAQLLGDLADGPRAEPPHADPPRGAAPRSVTWRERRMSGRQPQMELPLTA